MRQIEIRVCSRKKLYRLLEEVDRTRIAAVISTSWQEPDPEKMHGIPWILCQYQDIDYEGVSAFSAQDAMRVAEFVRGIGTDIHMLVAVCDAGASRSPAVAAAISKYFEIDSLDSIWRNPEYSPNMLVYEKLCEALDVPATDEEKDFLIAENRKAFQYAFAEQ